MYLTALHSTLSKVNHPVVCSMPPNRSQQNFLYDGHRATFDMESANLNSTKKVFNSWSFAVHVKLCWTAIYKGCRYAPKNNYLKLPNSGSLPVWCCHLSTQLVKLGFQVQILYRLFIVQFRQTLMSFVSKFGDVF